MMIFDVGVGHDKGGKLLRGPDSNEHVKAALEGKLSPGELSDEEHEAWAALFMEKMSNPGPSEQTFFQERKRKGLGVGLD